MSKTLTPTAEIEEMRHTDGSISISVWAIWTGVDRPRGYGISCGANRKLASRLASAIEAGAAYPNPKKTKDINGRSYITHDCRVTGRHLSADLKRLGF